MPDKPRIQRPEPAQRQSLVSDTPTPALPKSSEVTASTISHPVVSDKPRIQRPEPAQRQPLVPDPSMTPTPPKSSEVATGTSATSRPDVLDKARIQRLTRESCDIHRQICALNVRDASIISELKELNAPYIPGPPKADYSKHRAFFFSLCLSSTV